VKTALRILLALFFVAAGTNHFLKPQLYLGIMPPGIPHPELLNLVSGVAEILGGIGLLLAFVRTWAAWGLIALLVAVYPANLYATALGHMPGLPFSPTVLWLRLPFQAVIVLVIWWAALRPDRFRHS
jgi:uncharacterized membrane protein